jgi:hypothetical protein
MMGRLNTSRASVMRQTALFASAAPLSLILLMGSMPAAAYVTSSATLTDLQISLFDIDLSDGVAPSVMFAPDLGGAETNSVNGSGWVYSSTTGEELARAYYINFGAGTAPTPLSGADAVPGVSVSSSVQASGWPLGHLELHAQGSAEPTPGTLVSYIAAARGPVNRGMQFVLSPNTVLVFSGLASLTATVATGGSGDSGLSEQASASTELTIRGVGASGYAGASTQSGKDTFGASIPASAGLGTVSVSRRTSVAFTNASNFYINGALGAEAIAQGNSNVAAIPEPSSTPLVLAGVGVLLLVRRITRSRVQRAVTQYT